ncbi:DUF6894 family protein [Methylobacterium planeticum]|uniref:DUF6894 domain-containing protein n=1 Tax=Methylobacterium planeticum TaxID=2615211 RepID=A0A6N6MHQ3_9HYPH|nr:hypothetical protein [Methylobacterium planeticum]KAB1069872.1 hypothetical protein F6X51_24445 [Methylobacterium planeticum]
MPRYHFNVHDGRSLLDDDGTELPNTTFARREAIRYAGALLEDEATRLAVGEEWRLEVTDSVGLILFCLNFIVTEAPAISHAGATGA